MNRIVLVGRLTRDPETKILEDSEKVLAKFTLAVDRGYKNSNGEKEVDFIPVVFWGKKAEIISKYLKKGKLISLTGRLRTRTYEDKESNKRFIAEVVADEFGFIDSKKEEITA